MFMVSPRTAAKWAHRYRAEGPAGMVDRSSRPHRNPTRTPQPVVRRIVALRWRHRLGPVQIGGRLALPASNVHAVLTWCRINRLSGIDRVSGEPLRRYEHGHPGAMLHVDVTKFGNIPDGGGWRYVGRHQGDTNRSATVTRTDTPRSPTHGPLLDTCYLHTVIDDHPRVAYAEICSDEKAATRSGCFAGPPLGSTTGASPSSGSSPTTARPTGPTPGGPPATSSGSSRRRPGHTGPRRTARSVKTRAGAAPVRFDPGQGVTTVSCVRFVGRLRCSVVTRTGQTDLT